MVNHRPRQDVADAAVAEVGRAAAAEVAPAEQAPALHKYPLF